MNHFIPVLWVGTVGILAVASDLLDTAHQGGTLGGQALLFLAVLILGGAGWYLFKLLVKSNAENSRASAESMEKLVAAANAQRDQDRSHHDEAMKLFQFERTNNLAERGTNFTTLLTIARDSIAAMTESNATARENASALRELSGAIREMKESAHHDAMNPVERKVAVVNPPSDPIPVKPHTS